MKRLLALALFLVTAWGCASSTPARIAYNTIDGAVDAAQGAMKAFNERYQVGLQTEEDRTRALAYYAEFQATARLATQLAKDISQKESAITVASNAATKLIQLLAQLLPKKTEAIPLFWPISGLALGGVR
jgi:outer membrane protein TolC